MKSSSRYSCCRPCIALLALIAFAMLYISRQRTIDDFDAIPQDKVKGDKNPSFGSSGKKNKNPIRQISILGERNSGTRWTFDHMLECFGHELTVKKGLVRYKHWFQYNDPSSYPHDTLVLAQFRNPYDWLKAMQQVPHHSPAHLSTVVNQSWEVFLTKPWTMERIGSDLWPNRTSRDDNAAKNCQQKFHYRDIISCDIEPLPHEAYNHTIRYSEHQPFYEMRNDGSGEPYANLLEMRTDKIRNFLSVIDYPGVADVWVLQYEYLVHKGTQNLIDKVEEWTGIKPMCEAKGSQVRKPKKTRILPPEMAHHIREHLDWSVEGMIGYNIDMKREEVGWDW